MKNTLRSLLLLPLLNQVNEKQQDQAFNLNYYSLLQDHIKATTQTYTLSV